MQLAVASALSLPSAPRPPSRVRALRRHPALLWLANAIPRESHLPLRIRPPSSPSSSSSSSSSPSAMASSLLAAAAAAATCSFLLASTSLPSLADPSPQLLSPPAAKSSPLVEKLLERSRINKAKYDQQRLDEYYKRNFKDYFDFVKGSVQNKQNITEAEKAILNWLEKNK